MAIKPSDKEEEHFAKIEFEKKKRLEEIKAEKLAYQEKQTAQAAPLHEMPQVRHAAGGN